MPQLTERPISATAQASGTALSAELLQSMADDGLSRQVIADLIGCSKRTVNYWLKSYGISTTGRSPNHEVFGTRGDKPAKPDATQSAALAQLGPILAQLAPLMRQAGLTT